MFSNLASMKKGTHVKLTKISETNPGELPVAYWARGVLVDDIRIDHPIHLLRYARAAQEIGEPPEVSRIGEYQSSPVLSIEANGRVRTLNSVWQVTELGPLDEAASILLATCMETFPHAALSIGLDTTPQPSHSSPP
jgi:hypothetical protein